MSRRSLTENGLGRNVVFSDRRLSLSTAPGSPEMDRFRKAGAAGEKEVGEAFTAFHLEIDNYRTWIWNHRHALKTGD
jgi:hypothetical protein